MSPLTVIYEFDRFRLDCRNQRLTRDGLLVPTPDKTLPILIYLIQKRKQVVTLERLADAHFPKSPFGEEEVAAEVLKLRRLMDDTSKESPIIRFTLGQGYQFEAEVSESLGDSASDQNFGNKPEDAHYDPGPHQISAKSKGVGARIGMVVAAVAVIGIGLTIWKLMPTTNGGVTSFNSPSSYGTPQVAILPFQSLTGQASDESFNRTLTESIFNALSKQSRIQVVPQEAVQKYLASEAADPVTAGQQLGAQMIVRGMAHRLAGQIVVKVQLLNTQDGNQIWSSDFEGRSIPVIAAQISEKILAAPPP
jgi:TolB-like protein/DNA-binding winged helix-turn-helix (wHTH) protein